MSDRGMKKWAAYKSLIEHEPAIKQTAKNKEVKVKPLISNEEAEEINELLTNYQKEEVVITYFRRGELLQKEGVIKRIDEIERKLIMEDKDKILLKEICKIKRL